MIIGNARKAVNYTAKDYITDNTLMCLYDGIESRAYGEAVDGSGTTWYNLRGANYWFNGSWDGGTTQYFGDKWENGLPAYTSTGRYQRFQLGGFAYNYGGARFREYVLQSSFAMEFIVQCDFSKSNGYNFSTDFNTETSNYADLCTVCVFNNKLEFKIGNVLTTINRTIQSLEKLYVAIVKTNGVYSAYINGDFAGTLNCPSSDDEYGVVNCYYLTQYGGLDYIFAWRAYTRALTPAEVAHNYNIDKWRFGI